LRGRVAAVYIDQVGYRMKGEKRDPERSMDRTDGNGTHPGAVPFEVLGDVAVERTSRGGDLAQMLFLTDLLAESNHTTFKLKTPAQSKKLRKLVFRHDSFGDNMYPFLWNHFEKIVNIAPFAPFRFDEIFEDPPEIVLHLFTERYLTQAIHDDFFHQEGK